MSKHTPILFSTPMVQAILDGRKTMTRRVVKLNVKDELWEDDFRGKNIEPVVTEPLIKSRPDLESQYSLIDNMHVAPYRPGDILWVKETYYAWGRWRKDGTTKTGKQKWRFTEILAPTFQYRYSNTPSMKVLTGHSEEIGYYKRPSMFMPKSACRIFLRITDVRVERLGDITDKDAMKEGASLEYSHEFTTPDGFPAYTYRCGFKHLWQSINSAWNPDTWVWVVSFERVEKPEKF